SVSAILTLALGIGATTAIFSVVYGVLLRPLPYSDPNRIVRLWEQSSEGHRMNFDDPNFEDLRSQSHSLQGIAEYASGISTASGRIEASGVAASSVSGDFFDVMGMRPMMGRTFAPEEQRVGSGSAIVGHAFWRQYLNSARDLSSIQLRIDSQLLPVVGV